LQQIHFSYENIRPNLKVLKNITLNIFPGEILGLLGPNGAGKTTLIKCILGLSKPQKGKIFFKGNDISNDSVHSRAKNIGLIFQNPNHQLFEKTVEEEIKFSLKNLKLSKPIYKSRIQKYLKLLNLIEFKELSPFSLSGGQKRRVAIASILAREPELIIFDEPTVGQDAQQKKNLEEIIINLQKLGKTVIIITHDIDFIARTANRLVILNKGKIYSDGPTDLTLRNTQLLHQCNLEPSHFLRIWNQIKDRYQAVESEKIINTLQLQEKLE
jgi:energy-coupling factor transport system ATP-binding protein